MKEKFTMKWDLPINGQKKSFGLLFWSFLLKLFMRICFEIYLNISKSNIENLKMHMFNPMNRNIRSHSILEENPSENLDSYIQQHQKSLDQFQFPTNVTLGRVYKYREKSETGRKKQLNLLEK